eukprot:TRINITY_DN1135_c0_g1_i4.p1 TRINITY_DN1135_c0_g1~~TRINITY_DN1135_c0_g1_i4.p1  ORF type:complete len:492 (+),score=138.83 TRINITY_DN1135_c0_g1_i4:121-1596(+)
MEESSLEGLVGYFTRVLSQNEIVRKKMSSVFPLIDFGCCLRCCLCFLSVRELSVYQQQDKVLSLVFSNFDTSENKRDAETLIIKEICVVCFGCLQNILNDDFLNNITTSIKESGYEFDNYQLNISLPASCLARQYAMYYSIVEYFRKKNECLFDDKVENDFVKVKEAMKWVLGPYLSNKHHFTFQFKSEFLVKIDYKHEETAQEGLAIISSLEKSNYKRKIYELEKEKEKEKQTNEISSKVKEGLNEMDKKKLLEGLENGGSKVETRAVFDIYFERMGVYIAGRYNKLTRNISQTPWSFGDEEEEQEQQEQEQQERGKEIGNSVQEMIGIVLKDYFQFTSCNFSAAGREDIDVRMLGRGRPFMMELTNAKKINFDSKLFVEMQAKINQNKNVIITDLQMSSKNDMSILKKGAEYHKKVYSCIVWTEKELNENQIEKINSMKEFVIDQGTPLRVLHRRAVGIRKKMIHDLNCRRLRKHSNFYIVTLTTQAGT